MTDRFKIDVDSLTIGELEQVEELSGMPIAWLGDVNRPQSKLMRALVYVVKRRTDPTFTYEDAGNLKLETFNGSDPTDAVG